MTAEALTTDSLNPRVVELDLAQDDALRLQVPQVTLTEFTERIHPAQPARGVGAAPIAAPRHDRPIGLGIVGIGAFLGLWLTVDAIGWISAAFDHSTALGVLAAVAVAAGVGGAAAVIANEATSLFRLKSVEAIQERFRGGLDQLQPVEVRQAITGILAVVPRDGGIAQAIESFQRQAQAHHTAAQQIAMLARTVIAPLDRRAEGHVRTAVLRAFGITAISPTALSDAAFFLACGVRMVRAIAASYGHRPTAAATVHLLRRLVLEAGKLGAVDIASASLVQHLGGAVTERFASSAAEAMYAAYRMARLGIIVMDLCRPIPFRDDDLPSVTSLVANVVRRRTEEGKSGAGAERGREGQSASAPL
jgi:putative membrane protein